MTQSDDFGADKRDQCRCYYGAGLNKDSDTDSNQQPEILRQLRYVWKVSRHDMSPVIVH